MRWHEQLRTTREAKALTQQEMATMLGVTQNRVSLWENGKRTPSKRNRRKIANFIGVDVENIHFEEVRTDAKGHDGR